LATAALDVGLRLLDLAGDAALAGSGSLLLLVIVVRTEELRGGRSLGLALRRRVLDLVDLRRVLAAFLRAVLDVLNDDGSADLGNLGLGLAETLPQRRRHAALDEQATLAIVLVVLAVVLRDDAGDDHLLAHVAVRPGEDLAGVEVPLGDDGGLVGDRQRVDGPLGRELERRSAAEEVFDV